MKHLALPLNVHSSQLEARICIQDAIGKLICYCGDKGFEMASEIVRACNCHEELVEALQLAIEWFEGGHGEPGQIGCKSLEEIKQALAKATK